MSRASDKNPIRNRNWTQFWVGFFAVLATLATIAAFIQFLMNGLNAPGLDQWSYSARWGQWVPTGGEIIFIPITAAVLWWSFISDLRDSGKRKNSNKENGHAEHADANRPDDGRSPPGTNQ